jgi:hypothetical protein
LATTRLVSRSTADPPDVLQMIMPLAGGHAELDVEIPRSKTAKP